MNYCTKSDKTVERKSNVRIHHTNGQNDPKGQLLADKKRLLLIRYKSEFLEHLSNIVNASKSKIL